MDYFLNAFLVMCGIAAGLPLLRLSGWLSRVWIPQIVSSFEEKTLALMAERNLLDAEKVQALESLADTAWDRSEP